MTQQHAKQKQQVFDAVCEKILAGDIQPGDRVSEKALARELNCSIIPVREALGTLIALRVLDKIPHYGTFAPELKPEEMAEFADFRVMAYTYAVGRAAVDPEPRALEDLKIAAETFDKATRAALEKDWESAKESEWKTFTTETAKRMMQVYWAILPVARMESHLEFYRQADLLNVMLGRSLWKVLSRTSMMDHLKKLYVDHPLGCFIPAIEEKNPEKAQHLHYERHIAATRDMIDRIAAAGGEVETTKNLRVKLINARFDFNAG